MVSISSIIIDELAQYSITLSETGLERYMIDAGLELSDALDEYTAERSSIVDRILLTVVSRLLLTPDITEGGMSVKWDRASVRVYMGVLQARLGIAPTGTPTITNASNLW